MEKWIKFIIGIGVIFNTFMLQAQNCNCTVEQVEFNMVSPCDLLVGDVYTVSSTTALKDAINEVNSTGGYATILLEDGVYPIASTTCYPYITGNHIVFRSVSGNRDAVIWTGQGMKDVSPSVENGIYIVGNNITIADLTIRNVGNHGIAVEGDSLFVHNVRIQNTFEQMLKGTSAGNGADKAIVQCSLFEYPEGIGPQYYIGGLDIHEGNDWIVRDNIFKNISSPSGSAAEHAIHFWNHGADNLIERNLIYNCDRGIGFGLGFSPNERGIIQNNMVYNDGTNTFHDVGIGLESSPFTKVYNNTIFIEYQNAIEYRFEETVEVDIKNNLTNKAIKSRDGGNGFLNFNYQNAQESWFLEIDEGNLRLSGMFSEVVDQGEDVSSILQVDIDQSDRPQGSAFDIGAHEFLQSSATGNLSISNQVLISPNPSANWVDIQLLNHGLHSLSIYDLRTTRSLKEIENIDESQIRVRLDGFKSGIYFLKIRSDRDTFIKKLIIQKD